MLGLDSGAYGHEAITPLAIAQGKGDYLLVHGGPHARIDARLCALGCRRTAATCRWRT